MRAHTTCKSIFFNDDEVRSILELRKTQLRQPMITQPELGWSPTHYGPIHKMVNGQFVMKNGEPIEIGWGPCDEFSSSSIGYKSPFGKPGDLLWVREPWAYAGGDEYLYQQDPKAVSYKAGNSHNTYIPGGRWRPASHMPRWASRITLEITDIRVLRVQEISERDAIAEGFDLAECVRLFGEMARGVKWEFERYLINKVTKADLGDNFCQDCAKIVASGIAWVDRCGNKQRKLKGKWIVDGYNDHHESDSPRFCGKCDVLLHHSLTKFGVDEEIYYGGDEKSQVVPCTKRDAAILHNLTDGIGDLRHEHHPRIAKIGFATYWQSIHGNWDANPWVWALSFKQV